MQSCRHWLWVLTILAVSGFASAEQPAERTLQLDIPAQKMVDALNEFARQSGLQVLIDWKDSREISSPAISGSYSLRAALEILLANTGLRYEYLDARTISIRAAKPGEVSVPTTSGFDPGDAGPLRLAQAQAPATRPAEPEEEEGNGARALKGQGVLGGHVSDATSGSHLPGALVRILETGASTETDDLGNFRFRNLPVGRYTLSIMYLGYADKLWSVAAGSEKLALEFPLDRSQADVAQVTVFGTRSARALALNQQRTAENSSSIVSADMLGNFTGTTISEALRRVEGISVLRDAETGDGKNVVIRGMEPNLNNIQLNGLSLPGNFQSIVEREQVGLDRSPDLSFLLADSVAKITVNKTLLPSHDSAGTGGLVEIETKSPLDRPARFASFSVEGGRKAKDFGDDFMALGTLSGIFGAGRNFGLSAAAQYRKRSSRNFQYSTDLIYGPFQPLAPDGTPLQDITFVDPREGNFPFDPQGDRVFPTGVKNSLIDVASTNFSATISGAWQPGENNSLRLDLTRASDVRDRFSRASQFFAGPNIEFVPVAALDGEERWVYGWNGRGQTLHTYRSVENVKSITDSISLNGDSTFGRLDVNYTLGYAKGSTDSPRETNLTLLQDSVSIDPSMVEAGAVDPIEGRIITIFGERTGHDYPLPYLTDAGFELFNNAANYASARGLLGQRISGAGDNTKGAAKVSAHYAIDRPHFKYVEVGADFEKSRFNTTRIDIVNIGTFCPNFECFSAAQMGLRFDETDLAAIGRSERGFSVVSRSAFQSLTKRLLQLGSGQAQVVELYPSELDPRFTDQFTQEKSLATYVQGRIDFGKLEIIGGARLNRVEVLAAKLSFPEVYDENGVPDLVFQRKFTRFLNESAVGTDVLPRVLVNYRQSDKLVLRGGYFLSVARPMIQDLSQEQYVRLYLSPFAGSNPLGTEFGPLLSVNQGNPDLKPTITHNFDLSGEYYHDEIGLMRLSVFYKRSENLIETNISESHGKDLQGVILPDDPHFAPENLPDDLIIDVNRPFNSGDAAKLWGIEAGIERQFTFLPGIWSGFGIYTNLTYTDGSKTQNYYYNTPIVYDENGVPTSGGDRVLLRFKNQPYGQASAWTGTASLTYNKYGIDGTLTFGLQTRARDGVYQPYGLAPYSEEVQSLDLRIAKEFSAGFGKYNVFFEGVDLLKGPSDPDLERSMGAGNGFKAYTGGGFIGGRELRLGLRATF